MLTLNIAKEKIINNQMSLDEQYELIEEDAKKFKGIRKKFTILIGFKVYKNIEEP